MIARSGIDGSFLIAGPLSILMRMVGRSRLTGIRRGLVVPLGLAALLATGCGSGTPASTQPVNGNKGICSALAAWTKWDASVAGPPPASALRNENRVLMNRLEADAPHAKSRTLASEARATAKEIAAGNGRDVAGGMNSIALTCIRVGYRATPPSSS